MKKKIIQLLKNSLQGIAIACTIFTIVGIIFDVVNGGDVLFDNWSFTKQALACVAIGIGFSVPSEIYNNDKLPFLFKVTFHMGIGCTIYLISAFHVGWIPVEFGWKNCLIIIAVQIVAAFLVWFGYAAHYRLLARNMNKKIEEKNS